VSSFFFLTLLRFFYYIQKLNGELELGLITTKGIMIKGRKILIRRRWLDLMISEVFSSLNDSMLLVACSWCCPVCLTAGMRCKWPLICVEFAPRSLMGELDDH